MKVSVENSEALVATKGITIIECWSVIYSLGILVCEASVGIVAKAERHGPVAASHAVDRSCNAGAK